jgi:hypothetical protein
VARLMRAAGLRGATLRKFVVTTVSDPESRPPVDLVERRFYAERPNRLWVADLTYVPTWSGFLYLAVVLDVFSRKVVGWAMENHLRSELVLAAIDMAIAMRRPQAVIHHSDHGCQGDFHRSSQHLSMGGVAWEDHEIGLRSGQDERRCTRQADLALISEGPSKRSGSVLPLGRPAKRRHWRAACRSLWAHAGSEKPEGWRRSVWGRRLGDTCRLPNARNSRC